MSNKEFWEEEPSLFWAYRKSYMDKIKFENEMMNMKCWLNGVYVYEAISTVAYNILKKESQPVKNYMDCPIDIYAKTKSDEEKLKEEQLKIEEQIKESLKRGKRALNNNRKVEKK